MNRMKITFIFCFLAVIVFTPWSWTFGQLELEIEQPACGGTSKGKITAIVSTPGMYEYSIGDVNYQTSNVFEELEPGKYQIFVRDKTSGCFFTKEGIIEEGAALNVNIRESIDFDNICAGTIILNAEISGGTPPYQTSWPAEVVRVGATGWYELKVIDQNGCEGLARKYVTIVPIQCSVDPNDIIGPEGYSEDKWVAASDVLDYTIRFENDPDFATAPAQRVAIYHPFDEDVDPYSFRLADFGFANLSYSVPPNSSFYSGRLDARDSLDVFVDVTAGLDVVNNRAFWILESVDPLTGLPPEDPQVGLLPVNDSIFFRGEGFANFTVLPSTEVVTGDTIHAIAEIIFDDNEAILTPEIFNRVDANAPQSKMKAIPKFNTADSVLLTWSGEDGTIGSGVGEYALFYSENGGPFQLYQLGIRDTFTYFKGEEGNIYRFYTQAIDNVGNVEAPKPEGDQATETEITPLVNISAVSQNAFCAGETLSLQWSSEGINNLNVILRCQGEEDRILGSDIPAGMQSFSWTIPRDFQNSQNYRLVLQDTRGGSPGIDSVNISIFALPNAGLQPNISLCAGEVVRLEASGGSSYRWTPSKGLNNNRIARPLASPDISTTYFLKTTNQQGCSVIDSVRIELLPQDTTYLTATTCNPDESGTFFEALTNRNGCDSTIITTVELLPGSDTTFVSEFVCTEAEAGEFPRVLNNLYGCDSVIVTERIYVPVVYSLQTTAASCSDTSDGSISILPQGNYQYQWSTGDTSLSLQNLSSGSYQLTVSDRNGYCEQVENINLKAAVALNLALNGADDYCDNAFVQATPEGGSGTYRYLWNTGDSTAFLSDVETGRYEVTITESSGCTISGGINIEEADTLSLSAQIDPISCFGANDGSIQLMPQGGYAPYALSWENGTIEGSVNELGPGEYQFTVTDDKGCIRSASFELRAPEELIGTLDVMNATPELGGTAELSITGGTPPYNVQWSTGQQDTSFVDGLVAGSYQLVVSDARGCTLELPFEVEMSTAVDGVISVEVFRLFPNPASQVINIQLLFNQNETGQIEIFEMGGALVRRLPFEGLSVEQQVDLENWVRGPYLVKIKTEHGELSRVVVVE